MHFISEELENYIEDHSTVLSDQLNRLERATWQKVINPRMLSGRLQGQFLRQISLLMQPKCIVEVGTYTGYSALCLIDGLQAEGQLITIDINDELSPMHDEFLLQHSRAHQIKRMFGDATGLLPLVDQIIDLAFIDADKSNYVNYYEMLVPKMRSGGMILLDNVLWSGKVVEAIKDGDMDTAILVELNQRIQADDRVENVLLPLRDGLMMVRKK